MKIIYLNTWHDRCQNELAAFIGQEKLSTDIFCLQEADSTTREHFRQLLPEFAEHAYDKPFKGRTRFTIATYVKEPHVVDAERVLLQDSDDSGVALMLCLGVGDGSVTVVNVHGISFSPIDDKLDTNGRIEQSRAIIDVLRGTDGPAIIGGDFNLLPESRSIQMFAQTGYQNLVTDYHIPTTRNRLAWERFPDNIQYFADYVFASSDVHIRRFTVPQIEVSDHLPLIVEFDVSRTRHMRQPHADIQLAYDHP